MKELFQGDIVKIEGYGKTLFAITSKNAFIRELNGFHVCPMLDKYPEGPLHIKVHGNEGAKGTVICEQVKLIDPSTRNVRRVDHLPYADIMEVSDVLQGIFEYD